MIVYATYFRKHSCQSSDSLIGSGSVFLLSRKHLLTGPNTQTIYTLLGCHFIPISCQVPYSGYNPCTKYPLRIGKPFLLGICLSFWYFRYSSWLYRTFSRIKKKWGRKGGCRPFVPALRSGPCWVNPDNKGVITLQFIWENDFSLQLLVTGREGTALCSSLLRLWMVRPEVCHEILSRMTAPLASCLPIWLPESLCVINHSTLSQDCLSRCFHI